MKDEERADMSVLNDVNDVRDGYKQCQPRQMSSNKIMLTTGIICTY